MHVTQVFTPDAYPEYTYVERNRGKNEGELEFELHKSVSLISISGPSKSGKSKLVDNVVEKLGYKQTTVRGSHIQSSDELWNQVLDSLDAPNSIERSTGESSETTKGANAGVNLPGVSAGGQGSKRDQNHSEEMESRGRRGLDQVAELIGDENHLLFIDDAHYFDPSIHGEISESLKDAYEQGVTICVAYIPYRSDDLTKANPDLSGRVKSIELDYWEPEELEKIGEMGFNTMNITPSNDIVSVFAKESIGSPHLMQTLCLELCKKAGVHQVAEEEEQEVQVGESTIKQVLRDTANSLDYTTVFEIISGQTKKRTDRKEFEFRNNRSGHIYEAILCGIASNPPKLSLDRSELIRRVNSECVGETPLSGNLTQSVKRVDKWMSKSGEQDYIFEWIEERNRLEIPDPYLIFYLRWSDAMEFEPELYI